MSKRDAVLTTATVLFSRQGVRKTSMDEIARAAHVAKPTIYAYFENKNALYAEVCAHLGEIMLADARAAAHQDAPLEDRLTGMLQAQFTRVWELVHRSPHAQELLSIDNDAARTNVEHTIARMHALLADLLTNANATGELDLATMGLTADALARQLMCAGQGAGFAATSVDEQRAQVAALVHTLILAGRRGVTK